MCVACQIETQKTEAFGQTMVQTLNHGALSLMISIAHRTRLFELMSSLGPADTNRIAEAGGLQERYGPAN